MCFDTTQFSYNIIPVCSPNACEVVFNPNGTTFQSNCAKGLHFSAFHLNYYALLVNNTCDVTLKQKEHNCHKQSLFQGGARGDFSP